MNERIIPCENCTRKIYFSVKEKKKKCPDCGGLNYRYPYSKEEETKGQKGVDNFMRMDKKTQQKIYLIARHLLNDDAQQRMKSISEKTKKEGIIEMVRLSDIKANGE